METTSQPYNPINQHYQWAISERFIRNAHIESKSDFKYLLYVSPSDIAPPTHIHFLTQTKKDKNDAGQGW